MVATSNELPPKHRTLGILIDLIVFYHPKDFENIRDIISIARSLDIPSIAIIRRDKWSPLGNSESGILVFDSVDDLLKQNRFSELPYIILETYGTSDLAQLRNFCGKRIGILIGAEDYGIPHYIADLFPNKLVVRLPMRASSISYNVVTSLVLLLYELKRYCSSPTA